uniref:Uncharacterized protein n=1 Tax=Anopheles atroparvus TaxID=41427 RepID=A0A182JJG3_ANOAO
MVSISSDPPYYDGPKKGSKFLTTFARRLRIGKGSKSKGVGGNGAAGLVLEPDSEEELVILRHVTPDEALTGGSSGAESSTMVLLVPAGVATTAPPPPFKRANSFRQSLSFLLKRNRPKLTERSCTSDSDVVHELDEDVANARAGARRPVLDAFLPEQLPAKRHSTGDIFNEDLDADVRGAQSLRVGASRHRRVHSDSTSYGLTGGGKKGTTAVTLQVPIINLPKRNSVSDRTLYGKELMLA